MKNTSTMENAIISPLFDFLQLPARLGHKVGIFQRDGVQSRADPAFLRLILGQDIGILGGDVRRGPLRAEEAAAAREKTFQGRGVFFHR